MVPSNADSTGIPSSPKVYRWKVVPHLVGTVPHACCIPNPQSAVASTSPALYAPVVQEGASVGSTGVYGRGGPTST